MKQWFVYVARCGDGTLYTGIATDVDQRIEQHNGRLPGGARYTRGRRPVSPVYRECCPSRSAAARREAAIKRLTREQKERLIRADRQSAES